ncbi:aldo/keto reductase [Nonomuraea sp. NPDC026600]|uniref:aldo/keto reductase n=1 Tax=Nonomuraea sp. NPDC026600 TaxID=3155363 RepID=UPI0033E441C3
MRQVRLGQTDLRVSVIGFGTWAFGGDWGAVDLRESEHAIHHALDLGINLFDTAHGYGFGLAERLLGKALRERSRREDVVIATKGGLRLEGDRLLRDAGGQRLREGVEESLRNLGTDYIDLYQVHWPDPHTPPEETAGVLEELVGEGKIRHIGVSNHDAEQLAALARFGRVEALQPPYHLFRRDIEETVLPYAAAHDIGVLVYGPLAHGLLSGRLTEFTTFDADDWRSKSPDFTGEAFGKNLAVVRRLEQAAREWGIGLPQLSVAWTLADPAVHVAIVGARRPAQLDGTTPAAGIRLSEADLRTIDAILAQAVPVWGPHPEGM